MGYLTKALSSRQPGTLPGNIKENPNGDYAELKTITTRSGKQLNPIPSVVKPLMIVPPKSITQDEEMKEDELEDKDELNEIEDGAKKDAEEVLQPPVDSEASKAKEANSS